VKNSTSFNQTERHNRYM